MLRIFKVLFTQYHQLSIPDFVKIILRNLYYKDPLLIYACDIMTYGKEVSFEIPDYNIVKGTIPDLEDAKTQIHPVPWEFQCNIFDKVADFFIAKNDMGIQCICWIYYADDHNRILKLGPSEAEIKFCLTLPGARGKGLYPMVINAIKEYLRDKGFTRVYMCVHKDNKASIRGIEKAGFVYVDAFKLRKILGFQVSKRFFTTEV